MIAVKLFNRLNFAWLLFFVLICSPSVLAQGSLQKTETKLQQLILQLSKIPWFGLIDECNPMCWEFDFTPPMKKILEIGNPAQDSLINALENKSIKDQVIILLGGVGDEKAVEPIIKAMIPKSKIDKISNAKKINRMANVALTNITVADVIWHHGGGITIEKCRENARECWEKWWKQNKKSFTVIGITQSRRYSNYPNYGIYRNKN